MSYDSLRGDSVADFKRAFSNDLTLGDKTLKQVIENSLSGEEKPIQDCVAKTTHTGHRIFNFPPLEKVGQQLIRLAGATVPRSIYEEEFDCQICLINCCGIIVLPKGETIVMEDLMKIQHQNQTGELASADC